MSTIAATPVVAPVTLWPHQTRAINEWQALRTRRVCIVSPTGSGKTSLAAEIIRRAVLQQWPCLFLAHRKELIDQVHDRLAQFGVKSGVIRASDERFDPTQLVQVASIPTLARRGAKACPPANIVFVDECHRVMADTYQDVLDNYPSAFIIGLTATPWRTDNRGLADAFEGLVVAAEYDELIEQKLIVQPTMFAAPIKGLEKLKIRQGDYAAGLLQSLMLGSKLVGAIVPTWMQRASGCQTVVFASGVDHSRVIVEEFKVVGIAAEHLDAETPEEEREAVLARWRAGTTRVVSNCGILTEGFDYPELGCAILARPTKSKTLYLQMVGRVLRSAKDKTRALLLDHAGLFEEHGFPTDPQDYSLDQTRPTVDTEGDEREELRYRMCEECHCLNPPDATACMECGNALVRDVPLVDEAIELEEIAVATVTHCTVCSKRASKRGNPRWGLFTSKITCSHCKHVEWVTDPDRATQATFEQRVDEYKRLRAIGKDKGFKDGWCAYKYKDIFGHWPTAALKAGAGEPSATPQAASPPLPAPRT